MKKHLIFLITNFFLASLQIFAQVKVISGGNIVMSRPLDPSTFVLIGETSNNYPLYGFPGNNIPGKLSLRSYNQASFIVDHKDNRYNFKNPTFWPVVSNSNSIMMYGVHWGVSFNAN